LKITINRKWQGIIIAFLIFVIISVGILGIYSLHTSPTLLLNSGSHFPTEEHKLHKIENIEVDSTFFLRLPEFTSQKEEAVWWQVHRKVYGLLTKKKSITVEFSDKGVVNIGVEKAGIRIMPYPDVLKRTSLIYLVALIYVISAVSVFKKHHSTAGLILTFFLLSAGLYFISSAAVVNRGITIDPLFFKILIYSIYISGGGLITIVHFAFVFPRKKKILKRFSWIPYTLYIYFLITIIIYLSGITAFGTTFPLFCISIFIMIWAFTHSFVKEKDTFLKKQITLSFLAPIMAASVFVIIYLLPGVLGMTSFTRFTYFALFSLIIPFALPASMDNLRLYEQRIEAERNSYIEKENICQGIHDTLISDLTRIKCLSEFAAKNTPGLTEPIMETFESIRQTAVSNMDQLRNFIWAIDPEEDTLDDLYSHFKSYTTRLLNHLDIDIEFKPLSSDETLQLEPFLRFHLFNIYKEAITNIIKHSKAESVEVELSLNDKALEMKISDDGVGFSSENRQDCSYGIQNMKKRANKMGGVLKISSTEGEGTQINFILGQVLTKLLS